MMRLPSVSSRSAVLALLGILFLILHLRVSVRTPKSIILQEAVSSQIQHGALLPPDDDAETLSSGDSHRDVGVGSMFNYHFRRLLDCPADIIAPIQHARLPYHHLNISFVPLGRQPLLTPRLFNPTILPLPSWSSSGTYLVVSRVATEGLHQESLICLAELCLSPNLTHAFLPGTRTCSDEDQKVLGPLGGLRCKTEAVKLNIPPTPALKCEGSWLAFPDIPGFHDPRILWSGRGEPLIILNSGSQYGCIGLWVTDLRTLYPDLERLVNRHGKYSGPTISYHHLTELTRNPRSSRTLVEKNWILWFPGDDGEAYVQYDLAPKSTPRLTRARQSVNQTMLNDGSTRNTPILGRTFAKLIGNGFTTPNLTSPQESSCFNEFHNYDALGKLGHWHQGSNSLKLVLCTRTQVRAGKCGDAAGWNGDGREVHFAIMHRKFSNGLELPMRYERYIAVWEGRKPFTMLGVSKFPVLMKNEWARPWSEDENWPGGFSLRRNWTAVLRTRKEPIWDESATRSNAYFTYTPSIAWAWRPRTDHPGTSRGGEEGEDDVHHLSRLGTGYLGDDVLIGIGLDDVEQVFTIVRVNELVGCLRPCPGIVV